MSDDARRSPSLPHPRATALFARTVYRELRRADYSSIDLTRFVSDLMEVIASNFRRIDPELDERLVGVIDPETGLPNRHVLEQIVDFEIRRARAGGTPLLLVCIELNVPDWLPDDVVHGMHLHTASALRQRLRPDDTAARLPPNRFLLLLPGAVPGLTGVLATRFANILYQRRREDDPDTLPAGLRYDMRVSAWTEEIQDPNAFIDACLAAVPVSLERRVAEAVGAPPSSQGPASVELPPASVRGPASFRAVGLAPDARRPTEREVVLALGGGAVRAAAHVGVICALKEAGVVIKGIAGTSAGALVGAMLLTGQGEDEILDTFARFASTPCYFQMRRHYVRYLRGAKRVPTQEKYFRQSGLAFMSDSALNAVPDEVFAQFIEHFVGRDRDILTLSSPFAVAATDIVDGRPALFTRGPLHHALRASCAVPGLFAPQRDGGRLLVDGATVMDVPIGAALSLRLAAPVLAVHLERPVHRVVAFTTSAQVLTRAASLVHTELVREQLRYAPTLLSVPVANIPWLDFRRAAESSKIGRAATSEVIEELLREIDRARAGMASVEA